MFEIIMRDVRGVNLLRAGSVPLSLPRSLTFGALRAHRVSLLLF